MDGDAKINFKEFEIGMKSSLQTFQGTKRCRQRPKSGTGITKAKARIPLTTGKRDLMRNTI